LIPFVKCQHYIPKQGQAAQAALPLWQRIWFVITIKGKP
jgi:hypothetical protein